MTDIDRLEKLIEVLSLNYSQFAEEIGLKSPQTLYDIKKKRHGISKLVKSQIFERWPNIRKVWWVTGEEPIFSEHHEDNLGTSPDDKALLDIIKNLQYELSEKNKQISSLLKIINRLSDSRSTESEDGI